MMQHTAQSGGTTNVWFRIQTSSKNWPHPDLFKNAQGVQKTKIGCRLIIAAESDYTRWLELKHQIFPPINTIETTNVS